jgi:hypothetical protein
MPDDQKDRESHLILGLAVGGCFLVGVIGVILSFLFQSGLSLIASAIAFGILVHTFVR